MMPRCLLILWLMLASTAASAAETVLRVGLYENSPFVIHAEEKFSGMAVELWEQIADSLDRECVYSLYPSLAELVAAGGKGEIDILVTNLAVTVERAELVKFTFPWFDSGLRIIAPRPAKRSVWNQLVTDGHMYTYLFLFALFILVALAVTAYRKRFDSRFAATWRDGLAQSLTEVISVAKSGELPNHRPTWTRNLLISIWMICGMGILAFVTSTVASAMTTTSISRHRHIQNIHDLPGKRVGVLAGSGAETYLGNNGIQTKAYNQRDSALDDLSSGTLDAVVADTAVIEYWLAQNPESSLELAGPLFHPYKFAFTTRQQLIKLADAISVQLIARHEDGAIHALKAKYFNRSPADSAGRMPTATNSIVPSSPFPMLVPNQN